MMGEFFAEHHKFNGGFRAVLGAITVRKIYKESYDCKRGAPKCAT